MQGQSVTYSGVGAHHQNGAAERIIQTVMYWSRAMMMHQLLHWPDKYSNRLWPFAVEHAVYLWNNVPRQGHALTPLELFTGMKQPNDELVRARVWGCPTYVLDPKLQDGKKLPKWKKRSRCGMYLGQSLDHHNTVGKILNFQTGFVSPQFHCVYDELFTSCFGTVTDTVFDKEHWDSMLQFSGNHTSHVDPVSPDPARREQIAHIQQDLFDIFRHPDHVTPPPPPVPEGDGPILPLQIGGDEGTSRR